MGAPGSGLGMARGATVEGSASRSRRLVRGSLQARPAGADERRIGGIRGETRRAEYVHWAALAPLAAMPWWNPRWLTACMSVYAVAANGPCIVAQRYNRARIENILRRRGRRPLPVAP